MHRTARRLVVAAVMVVTVAVSSGCTRSHRYAPTTGTGGSGFAGATDEPVRSWRWTAPPGASVGMPAVDSGGVAFTFGHLGLVLLDPAGAPRWRAERLGLRDVAPLLTPEVVVAAADDGVVAADRVSGAVRWDRRLGERANTPVLAAGRAVVTTWEGSLVAVDLATGEVAWRMPLPAGPLGPAAVSTSQGPGGTGTAGSAGSDRATVVATWESDDEESAGAVGVDAATGARLWEKPLPPGGVSAPAAAGRGRLVVVAGDRAAHGLDAVAGDERWRTPTDGAGAPEMPPSAPGDGTVVIAHRLAGVAVADGDTGAVRWQARLDATAERGSPAGPGPTGRVALGLFDGNVMVVGPADGYVIDMPSPVSGVALGAGGSLIVTTAGGDSNFVQAYSHW